MLTKQLLDHSKLMKELNKTVLTITILGTILTLHYRSERFTGAKNLSKEEIHLSIQKVSENLHSASSQNNQSKQVTRILYGGLLLH